MLSQPPPLASHSAPLLLLAPEIPFGLHFIIGTRSRASGVDSLAYNKVRIELRIANEPTQRGVRNVRLARPANAYPPAPPGPH